MHNLHAAKLLMSWIKTHRKVCDYKGKHAAFDTPCIHALHYPRTSRRITECAFFFAVAFSASFCLFCASLRVGLSVAKTDWMPPRVLVYVTYLVFVPSSSLHRNLFFPFSSFFPQLARILHFLDRVKYPANYQTNADKHE